MVSFPAVMKKKTSVKFLSHRHTQEGGKEMRVWLPANSKYGNERRIESKNNGWFAWRKDAL